MADQAKAFGCSVSYISAVERGSRAVPAEYPASFASWLNLSELEAHQLRALAARKKTVIRVMPKDSERAAVAAEFADVINQLPAEQLRRLRHFLSKADHCKYSSADLRKWALLARSCFDLGNQLTFDLIDVLENKLAQIDTEFVLQVDANDILGDKIAAYADAINAHIQKIVLSEHAYSIAKDQTPEGRFIAAHELGHWLLHPQRGGATFQRYGRYQSKLEDQADRFAREFLMPEDIVLRFKTPNDLAFACNVPPEQARLRMSELGVWPLLEERERVKKKFADLLTDLKRELAKAITTNPETTEGSNFQLIPFPVQRQDKQTKRARRPRTKKSLTDSLSLFEYAELIRSQNHQDGIASSAPDKKQDFIGMLEAVGYYSGKTKACQETAVPNCSAKVSAIQPANSNRAIDWYKRYGWR